MNQSTPIAPWSVLKAGIKLTKSNFLSFLPLLVLILFGAYFANSSLMELLAQQSPDAKTFDLLAKSSAIVGLLLAPLEVGLMLMGLKAARGNSIKVSDISIVFRHSARIIVLAMLTMVVVQLGFMLLIFPGLYLLVILSMAPMVMCDKNMSMFAAVKMSALLISKQWFSFFLVYIVLIIVILLSLLTQGIALIVTLPYYVNVKGLLYCQLFDTPETDVSPQSPKTGEFEA